MAEVQQEIRAMAEAYQAEVNRRSKVGEEGLDEAERLDCLINMMELVEKLPGFNLCGEKFASLAVKLLLGEVQVGEVKFSKPKTDPLMAQIAGYQAKDEKGGDKEWWDLLAQTKQWLKTTEPFAFWASDKSDNQVKGLAWSLLHHETTVEQAAARLRDTEGKTWRPKTDETKEPEEVKTEVEPKAQAKGEASEILAQLDQRLTQFGEQLVKHLDQFESRLNQGLNNAVVNALIRELPKLVGERVDASLDKQEARTKQWIEAASGAIITEIYNKLAEHIDQSIGSLSNRLVTRFDELPRKVEGHVASVLGGLPEEIAATVEKIFDWEDDEPPAEPKPFTGVPIEIPTRTKKVKDFFTVKWSRDEQFLDKVKLAVAAVEQAKDLPDDDPEKYTPKEAFDDLVQGTEYSPDEVRAAIDAVYKEVETAGHGNAS